MVFTTVDVVLLGPSGQRPGMPLNILQGTGHLPRTKNYPVQIVNSVNASAILMCP